MDEMNDLLANESSIEDQYLTFSIGEDIYGIEIEYVSEIIMVQAITEVPEVPNYIKGIINLRGKILPVMDVRVRFNMEPMPYNDRTCIMVINFNNALIGLIVDTVCENMDIPPDVITEPAIGKNQYSNRYIRGIGKTHTGIKLLINTAKLISDKD